MKLTSTKVTLYRNILDSTDVEVQPDVACLVGKNESGKTAFLRALRSLNPARGEVDLSVPDDYPAWLEKKHRLAGTDLEKVQPIQALFKFEETDKALVSERFGTGTLLSESVTVLRCYDGKLVANFDVGEQAAALHTLQQVELPKGYAKRIGGKKATATFSDLKGLAEALKTSTDKADVAAGTELEKKVTDLLGEGTLRSAVWKTVAPRLPKVFYFASFSTLPYSVGIRDLLEKDKSKLTEMEATARSLLELASVEKEFLLNADYERRKRELENVANMITEDVLKYWTQNDKLRVEPDITQTTVTNPQGQKAVLDELKLRIRDDRHMLSLPFDRHSAGFRWFFSFLAAFSEYENSDPPVLILLDEPAVGLHAKAQDDFLRFINERLSKSCQVIYSTHSPFMIEPGKLERVRLVEDKGREHGTKVTKDALSTDPDTLFPLQSALGYDLVQHLFIAPHNLVVEGTSDFTYLVVISDFLRDESRKHLDPRWSIVPVGGADLVPTFVALLGTHLDVTVLVDARSNGHQKLTNLVDQGRARIALGAQRSPTRDVIL